MSSFLQVKDGIYNPLRRFAFTNISEEEFPIQWDGKVLALIQPGETVELPHHLAVLATTNLVDKIMMEEVKADEIAHVNTPNYRGRNSMGVPQARKPYEDRILKEIEIDPNSSQFRILASQEVDKIKADLNAKPAAAISKISVPVDSLAPVLPKLGEKETEFPSLNRENASQPPTTSNNPQ